VKPRKYTGTKDGISRGPRKGMLEFIRQVETLTDKALWNNGHWVVRSIKGTPAGGPLSVHATGRAVDLSYRKMPDKGKVNGRKHAEDFMELLVANNRLLGIELILDYMPAGGRGWRCDRLAWQDYGKPGLHGSPGGDWLHVEISPRMADSPQAVVAAFATLKAT
jgi:hypothetical protein